MSRRVGGESYGDILTEKRADDWIAWVRNEPGIWDAGKTETIALGNLIISLHAQNRAIRLGEQHASMATIAGTETLGMVDPRGR